MASPDLDDEVRIGQDGASASEPQGSRRALATVARRDRERAVAAQAMAARERVKTRRAEERVRALERELAALRGSAAWRLTFPVRKIAAAIPPSLYGALRGRRSLIENATAATATVDDGSPSPPAADDDDRRPIALLLDDLFPVPDRDSGSIDIVNLAEVLQSFGFRVLFGADRDHLAIVTRRDALAARGIYPLGISDAPSVDAFIERQGAGLALIVLNRLYCGGNYFEAVRAHASQARIVFNTVDLHWVRMEREAALRGDAALGQAAARAKARELQLARECDLTIVVSAAECHMLAAAAPGATVLELPLARPVRPPQAPFAARQGIGFIGGFSHAPNLDALRWFASDIWPLVRRQLPDCRFSVVGPDLPAGTLDGVAGRIEILGHLPDIGPWFESLRVTAAPLRFGAGAKGKVVSSLAAGVPCVGTALAFEGMRITPSMNVAQAADTPDAFADLLVAVHENPGRWKPMSAAGVAHAERHFSIATWRDRIGEMLWVLGALPAAASD